MKVLLAKQPGVAAYTEEFPKPVPTGDEVLVKVVRNGICATDMEILSGAATFMQDGSTSYPVRFGHEFVGDVVELGPDVTKFNLGDKVMSVGYVSCGHCDECLAGNYTNCKELRSVGTVNTYPGSYAEYVLFPQNYLIGLPSHMDYDQAALIEPAGVGMLGVKKANIVPGKSYVLVIGVGAIGIAAAVLAKHYGAKKVILSGRTPYKLDIARQMGVDVVCNPKEESLTDVVLRETDGHGVDAVIECSGSLDAFHESIQLLARGGTMAIVAFYGKPYDKFDIDAFILNDCNIVSVMDHATPEVLQAMAEGVDLRPLITRHIKFSECGAFMMEKLNEKGSQDIKVMVDFD